jgi:MOSC domain-containing protein YiiM
MSGVSAAAVQSVQVNPAHTMAKRPVQAIELVEGLGVLGDAHYGATVQHRSRVRQDPAGPNLRQVHLIQGELLDELAGRGFRLRPGQMGENITTRGVDLLALPKHTIMTIGPEAMVLVTGLRNPCTQLDGVQNGLMAAVLERSAGGALIRKAGIMAIVIQSGRVRAGDAIRLHAPPEPRRPLDKV